MEMTLITKEGKELNLTARHLSVYCKPAGKWGVVAYTTPEGMVGVALAGEGNRVDEWHPSQLAR